LRADYEKALSQGKKFDFEFDALSFIENFVSDCERKKEIAKRKLKETQDEMSEEHERKVKRIEEFDKEVNALMAKVEEAGDKGDVDESMRILAEIDKTKARKAELEVN
jgi:RNA-binding protein Luc7-like 2